MPAVTRCAYGIGAINAETFQKRYLQHQEQVLEYFSGRPDFLAIDISHGNPWQRLCGFLQLPVPRQANIFDNRNVVAGLDRTGYVARYLMNIYGRSILLISLRKFPTKYNIN